MKFFHIDNDRATVITEPGTLPVNGFVWLDCLHEEVTTDPEVLRSTIERLTNVRVLDLHLQDAINLQHPSYFDNTQYYDMLVFRKLAFGETAPLVPLVPVKKQGGKANERRALQEIITRPITFFVVGTLLVTVRNGPSKTIDQVQHRLLDVGQTHRNAAHIADKLRLPASPEDLVLRLLNGMVDRYLELRQPLTHQLDRWQRELLDPSKPFNNWLALLEARIEIRKLDNLCEEQYDALQEMRDSYLDSTPHAQQSDIHLARLNDVMEHVGRVLHHARRLEASVESAVQLHFSAMSHRTNQVVKILTVITAIFAPLTLITGIFGMNFDVIPGLHHPLAFWITIAGMLGIALLLLGVLRMRFFAGR